MISNHLYNYLSKYLTKFDSKTLTSLDEQTSRRSNSWIFSRSWIGLNRGPRGIHLIEPSMLTGNLIHFRSGVSGRPGSLSRRSRHANWDGARSWICDNRAHHRNQNVETSQLKLTVRQSEVRNPKVQNGHIRYLARKPRRPTEPRSDDPIGHLT